MRGFLYEYVEIAAILHPRILSLPQIPYTAVFTPVVARRHVGTRSPPPPWLLSHMRYRRLSVLYVGSPRPIPPSSDTFYAVPNDINGLLTPTVMPNRINVWGS